MGEDMRREFLGKAKDVKGVVKAFVGMNAENALKTKPKVWLLLFYNLLYCKKALANVGMNRVTRQRIPASISYACETIPLGRS